MTEVTYIYALTDPRTEEVRYIGKTIHSPLDRLESHIDGALKGGRSYKNSWIKGLLSLGLEPDMSVLEIVFNKDVWQDREKWWIAFARKQQCQLTNLTDGGEGHSGHSPTQETRDKISKSNRGKVKSEEHRRKLSKANIGKKLSEGTRQKIRETSTGRKHSKETRQKISESNRRRTVSDETRQKIGKSSAGRVPSEETRLRLSKARSRPYPAFVNVVTGDVIPAGVGLRSLCRERGLDSSGMCAVKNGRLYSYKSWILLEGEE